MALETEMAFLKAFGALLGATFTWFLWAMGNRRDAPTVTAPMAEPDGERDYIWATDPEYGAVPGDLARGRQ